MIIMAVAGAVQAALAGTDVSVTAGVGLIAARDNGVTSEQAGAKRGLGG